MNVLQSFGSVKTFASSALCFLLRPGISYDVFTSVSMKHDLIILQGSLRALVLSRPFCFLDIKKLIFLQWLITLCMEWLLCEIMISIQVFPLIMSLSFSRMLTWLSSTQVSCQSGCRTLNPFFLLISPLAVTTFIGKNYTSLVTPQHWAKIWILFNNGSECVLCRST